MKLKNQVIRDIVKRLIAGEDYRIEIVNLINAEFLEFAVGFFKKVVSAKLENQIISIDWYRQEFGDPRKYNPTEIAIHFGLNKKTITNMYRKAPREIVLDAANEHFENLSELIENLIEQESEIDLTLTIKFKGVSADLSMNESLIVINALAVKRAALRGGAWSTAGKGVETVLMTTLCKLFSVPTTNYARKQILKIEQSNAKKGSSKKTNVKREVDFFLLNDNKQYKCEIKLMGAGNSESVDDVIARDSDIFIADTLSLQNKQQLNDLEIQWVELRTFEGYRRFKQVLEFLNIPHQDFTGDLNSKIEMILDELL